VRVGFTSGFIEEAVITKISRFDSIAEARSAYTERIQEMASQTRTEPLGIADQGFYFNLSNLWEVNFRFHNLMVVVQSTASFPRSGSKDAAIKWAERLADRIRNLANTRPVTPTSSTKEPAKISSNSSGSSSGRLNDEPAEVQQTELQPTLSPGVTPEVLADTLLPDIQIATIEHSPEFVLAGEVVTWTITVENTG